MLTSVIIYFKKLIKMSKLVEELARARAAAGLSQQALADSAGVTRMTIQKLESEHVDPRLSTLEVLARALGMELMLVPQSIRPDLEDFVRAGGKLLGQAPGVSAPGSIVDEILRGGAKKKGR